MQKISGKDCNLCGSNNSKFLFTKNSYPILRCHKCGLTYTSENGNIYPQDYYDEGYFKGEKRKYGYIDYHNEKEYSIYNFKKYWAKIERYINGGRVLDIGCATGLFLECAGRNWQCYGLDISEYASQIAQDKIGQNIKLCQLLDAP